MKASEYLGMARDQIEKGWARGTLEDGQGNVCAVGSLKRIAEEQRQHVTGLDDFASMCQAGNGAATALDMLAREFGAGSIMSFNDNSREKQNVLNWFDKAIIGLEERGE
jgi:hypothetical protein